jgi:hypothetical protein
MCGAIGQLIIVLSDRVFHIHSTQSYLAMKMHGNGQENILPISVAIFFLPGTEVETG